MHPLLIDIDQMTKEGYYPESIDYAMRKNDQIESFLKSPLGNHLNSMDNFDEFDASGGYIHTSESIKEEIKIGTAPCGFIFPFGYLPVWSSLGGNQIVYSLNDGGFYWADHISFSKDQITIPVSYEDIPFSEENIKKALILISNDDPDNFIRDMIAGKYEEMLEELD